MKKTIGQQIFEQRNKQGISQLELGQKIGLKTNQITNWENGRTHPSIDQLTKMNELFGWEFIFKK